MGVTITTASGTITPTLVLALDIGNASRTIKHPTLDGTTDYSLQRAGATEGTYELFFADEADAFTARAWVREPGAMTWADTDHPDASMEFVLGEGEIRLRLDPVSRRRWILTLPVAEVEA